MKNINYVTMTTQFEELSIYFISLLQRVGGRRGGEWRGGEWRGRIMEVKESGEGREWRGGEWR